ncbi:uncharacterized protein LOC122710047 [Cervus elaphus]|uniref:uncharacterized protein LOC122710047 n=1 Tax=Cervus elaphus TaxID=9860 RepID=UPI001CC295CE|nr:uncharacterized protein LOC122710047 [Cervus elaphus]
MVVKKQCRAGIAGKHAPLFTPGACLLFLLAPGSLVGVSWKSGSRLDRSAQVTDVPPGGTASGTGPGNYKEGGAGAKQEKERVRTPPAGQKTQRGSNKLPDKQQRTHGQTASLRFQVELRDHSRNQRCQPLGSAAPSFSGRRLCPDLRRKATNCPRLTSRPSHCCSQTSPSPTPSGRTRAPLPERRAQRARPVRRWLGSVEPGQMDPGRRHPGTFGVVEDTDWPGPGHVTIRSRARVSCSWWIRGGDSSSTPHWSPDQREGSCQGSPGVCDPQRCSSRCGKPRAATLFPSPRTTGEPTTGRTDRDFVNDVSEKEQRWGAKAVPLSGHQEHINIHKLRENVFQEHKTLREKELEMGPKASHSYGRKFGVEQDRMDKSAVGLEYQSKLSKCCLQVDSIWGFGGKFGVQLARVDQNSDKCLETA